MKKRLDILVYEKGFTDSRDRFMLTIRKPISAELLMMKMLKLK